jgi:L-alanine-DL-glutamate epimerase-like enolase superfamily enzyme
MPTLAVFDSARASGTDVYTHCWGGGIGVLANYHAAIAGGGTTVEWALPSYPIRDAFFEGALTVTGGVVSMTSAPGLGATLTREIEDEFRFREEAVYRCWVDPARVPAESAWE